MRQVIATILSWVSVSAVFIVALHIEGMKLHSTPMQSMLMLTALVGFSSLLYFIFVGAPVAYVILKYSFASGATFIVTGIIASIPIVLISCLTKNIEWAIAAVLAGIVGGSVFAVLLPKQSST